MKKTAQVVYVTLDDNKVVKYDEAVDGIEYIILDHFENVEQMNYFSVMPKLESSSFDIKNGVWFYQTENNKKYFNDTEILKLENNYSFDNATSKEINTGRLSTSIIKANDFSFINSITVDEKEYPETETFYGKVYNASYRDATPLLPAAVYKEFSAITKIGNYKTKSQGGIIPDFITFNGQPVTSIDFLYSGFILQPMNVVYSHASDIHGGKGRYFRQFYYQEIEAYNGTKKYFKIWSAVSTKYSERYEIDTWAIFTEDGEILVGGKNWEEIPEWYINDKGFSNVSVYTNKYGGMTDGGGYASVTSFNFDKYFLIKADNEVYTIKNNALSLLINPNLTSGDYIKANGVKYNNAPITFNLNKNYDNIEIYDYCDSSAYEPSFTVEMDAIPNKQYITTDYIQVSDVDVTGIKEVKIKDTGNPLYLISFNDGQKWYYMKDGVWVEQNNELTGMTSETFQNITTEDWNKMTYRSLYINIKIIYSTLEDSFESIAFKFING